MKTGMSSEVFPPTVRAMRRALPDIRELARHEDDVFLAELRLALQLPRFSEPELSVRQTVLQEIRRVLDRVRGDQQAVRRWQPLPRSAQTLERGAYEVRPVADEIACAIHRHLHYIGSAREGVHFGLFERTSGLVSVPLSLLTFSEFDLAFLEPSLPVGVDAHSVSVLSRVYSFSEAPANAFSHTFSKALPLLQDAVSDVKLIVTYVNPNVGFTGSSYLASNWLPFAQEANIRYEYLDSDYVTRRELDKRFGTTDFEELRRLLGSRITTSKLPLWPLRLFAYPVTGQLREVIQRGVGATFNGES